MATTSVHKALIRTGFAPAENCAVGASVALDYAINNLLHLADEYGQVRLGGSVPASGGYYIEGTYVDTYGTQDYYLFLAAKVGSALVHSDGLPYRSRIRIAGFSSDAKSVKFVARVGTNVLNLPVPAENPTDALYVTNGTTSGSGAWLTGVSVAGHGDPENPGAISKTA